MNILHKLGLCKLSEVNTLADWAVRISVKADAIAEKAKDTEDCYKAVLAMYNEAQTTEHAVDVISAYCGNQRDCTECDFHDGKCKLAHIPPCWWNLLEVSK